MSETAPGQSEDVARRVVLSYPENLSQRTRDRVAQAYYRKYLGRVHDEVAVGDIWEEFTDVGCCGSQIGIDFHVEKVDGGSRMSTDTEIEFVTREWGSVEGGWTVQNEID